MTLLHGCDGLSAQRMAVLWTCRAPALGRHVRRGFMRNALFDFTPIRPATACHQRNYVATYSRFIVAALHQDIEDIVVLIHRAPQVMIRVERGDGTSVTFAAFLAAMRSILGWERCTAPLEYKRTRAHTTVALVGF